MRRVRAWCLRLSALFNKQRRDRELADELEAHLQMHIEDNLRSGMTPEGARRDALIKLGGMEATKEAYRDRRGIPWLETLIQDLRYGARTLRKDRGFTAVVVLTLALGIGVNTAIFSILNAVMLRALPYPDPDQLVEVLVARPKPLADHVPWAPEALAWQEHNQVFSQFGVYREGEWDLSGGEEAERVSVADVSTGFLRALGVQPVLGRIFANDEDRPGGPPVAILSYRLWQRRFGGDTNAVGKTITIDHQVDTIIGVLPSSFQAPVKYRFSNTPWDVLRSLRLNEKTHGDLWAFGRIKPRIGIEQARAALDILYEPFRDPARKDKVALLRLQDYLAANARFSLLLCQGAVGFVLLIACANVANLLLARATGRRREISVRVALGAGRFRIIRQLLTESVLLALLGSAIGLLLAFGIKDTVRSLLPDLRNISSAGIDGRVMIFTFLAAVLTGLIFGLVPALESSRVSLNETLKEGSRRMTGERKQHRLQGMFVVAEIAVALVLLVSAGLLLKCFFHVHGVEPGFRTDRLLTMTIELSGNKYRDRPSQTAFFQRTIEELRSLPGVETVAADTGLPLVGPWDGSKCWVEDGGHSNLVHYGTVDPDCFRALGIPLKKGRFLTDRDRTGAPGVVLVNESFVRLYLPGKQPVGQLIRCDGEPETIVGVVGDVCEPGGAVTVNISGTWRVTLPGEASPRIYFCYLQYGDSGMGLALRTQVDPMMLATAARSRIRNVDPDQVVCDLKTMEQRISESLIHQRTNMWLSGTLGALALALAAIGIFGVMSFTVAQRTHEIGVRMALGAQASDVLRQVLGRGLKLTVPGMLLGLAAALGLTRFLSSQLYGVSALDPLTFIGASVVLGGIAMLACYLPARRAARVDPMVALRYE